MTYVGFSLLLFPYGGELTMIRGVTALQTMLLNDYNEQNLPSDQGWMYSMSMNMNKNQTFCLQILFDAVT